jgi:hypothetical protein
MSTRTLKFFSFILIVISILCSGLLFVYTRWQPKQLQFDEFEDFLASKTYAAPFRSILVPTEFNTYTPPDYPFVGISPTQKKYWFVMLKEKQESPNAPVFYANKRISELLVFHDILSVEDWQKQLNVYRDTIHLEIQRIQSAQSDFVQTTLYAQLYQYLLKHKGDLIDSEKFTETSDERASQILPLIEQTFSELMAQIPEVLKNKNTYFYYPLDIAVQRQFGTYYLEVDSDLPLGQESNFLLSKNDHEIVLHAVTKEDKKVFISEPVEITSSNDKIQLRQITDATTSAERKPRIIAQEVIPSAENEPEYVVTEQGKDTAKLILKYFSTRERENLIKTVGAGWRVKNYTDSSPTETIYQLEFWPRKVLKIFLLSVFPFVLCVGLIILTARTRVLVGIERAFSQLIQKAGSIYFLSDIEKFVVRICTFFRYPLFVIFSFGLVIDIFLFNSTSYLPLTLVLLVLWFAIAVGYRIHERMHFAFGVFFFLLIPILLIFRRDTYAEKMSSWAYIFFVFGSLELILRQIFHRHLASSVRETLRLFGNDIYSPFNGIIRKVFIPFGKFLFYQITLFHKILTAAISLSAILLCVKVLFNQFELYQKFYKQEPLKEFLLRTVSFEMLSLLLLAGIIFYLLKKIHLLHKIVLFCILGLLLQLIVFHVSTYQLRTKAVITGLNKSSGSMWSEIIIYGNNFGHAPYNNAAVYIEGTPQRVLDWKNERIVFVVDPIDTKTGKLWVVSGDKMKSNMVNFEYLPL